MTISDIQSKYARLNFMAETKRNALMAELKLSSHEQYIEWNKRRRDINAQHHIKLTDLYSTYRHRRMELEHKSHALKQERFVLSGRDPEGTNVEIRKQIASIEEQRHDTVLQIDLLTQQFERDRALLYGKRGEQLDDAEMDYRRAIALYATQRIQAAEYFEATLRENAEAMKSEIKALCEQKKEEACVELA